MAPSGLGGCKKGARRTGRSLAFLDETGHTFRARVGTTWAPRGHPPVLRRVSRRREVSSIVCLTVPLNGQPARLYARHLLGAVHAGEVVAALGYFRRQVGRPLLLVWDRLNVHRSRRVQRFLGTHAQDFLATWLPSYAPELNPEEQCNQWVKQGLLNALPDSVDTLRAQARGQFRRLGRRPDLLQHFFDHAGLSVN